MTLLKTLGALILLALVSCHANAQTFTTLYSFSGGSNGNAPLGSLAVSGSTIYGTTNLGGGGYGTVFSIGTNGSSYQNLFSNFRSPNGIQPNGVILSGSTLYGTTTSGGTYGGYGTVFSINTNNSSLQSLFSFNGTTGYEPYGSLTLGGTILYGTTYIGGTHGSGNIFSIPISGGTPTTLYSFNNADGYASYGYEPQAAVTLNGSTLYGVTSSGGAYGDGVLFSINTNGSGFQTLLSFSGTSGTHLGQMPLSSLTLNGSTLYGTTYEGGAYGHGTIFSINTNGGGFQTLLSFSGTSGTNLGANPIGGLTLSGTTLYGTTKAGGANDDGTIFSIPVSGGPLTTVLSFSGPNGAWPEGTLTLNGSSLYGTTYFGGQYGGPNGDGTVFSLTLPLATISLTNAVNVTIITGGTATLSTTLTNSAPSGNNNLNFAISANLQSGNATLGSTTPASGSLAPSASQTCTVSATSANLGLTTISFTASDPNASNSPQTSTGTLTVLGHAAPSLSVTSGNNQTVIVGATGISAGLSLSNGTLNQSGLAALDVNSLGTLVSGTTGNKLVSSGSTQAYTATLSTGTLGTQVETFLLNAGDDHTLPGASAAGNVSAGVTLTVLDHSNASFSSTATQTTQTISFGNVLRGATIPSQNFTIYNRAAYTSAAYTANLKLTTGFTAIGDTALSTNLSTFNGLTASNGTTCTASLNTSNYTTTGIKTISMSASQLADDSTLSGVGNNNNGGITITLDGNVGNATADKSNFQTSFGTALTAPVAQNASYANLESMATATTGSGGYNLVGSTATILWGTNSSGSAQTVSMAWRTQTLQERTEPVLISDVVDLSGMKLDGTGQTSPFVLQMTYNPSLLPLGAGSEGLWASNQWLYLGYLNPNTDQWVNAVSGNFGSSNNTFVGVGAWSGDTNLGDWGVNTANDTVWAVVNHNSEFAVVPEPSTLILLGIGAIGLVAWALRRRQSRSLSSEDESTSQDDGPAILSMPCSCVEATRRAA